MKKNKKGFTLVELVIVVAVMAVLVAVAIPTVTSITKTAKETVAKTNAQTIESTLKLKEADMNKEGNVSQLLNAQNIYDAVDEAKLGITGYTFYYYPGNGTVAVVIPGETDANKIPTAPATGDFIIEFAANGTLKVTGKGLGAAGEGGVAGDQVITAHS